MNSVQRQLYEYRLAQMKRIQEQKQAELEASQVDQKPEEQPLLIGEGQTEPEHRPVQIGYMPPVIDTRQ